MKIIKKYTAMQIGTQIVDDTVEVSLEYGEISGPYYSRDYPEEEFDTEEDAIKYAYKQSKYSRWLIIPMVSFEDN